MNGIGFVWDAKARALRVQPDYARRAAAMFTHGYGYLMVPDRTPEDHRHMFALIRVAWETCLTGWATSFRAPTRSARRPWSRLASTTRRGSRMRPKPTPSRRPPKPPGPMALPW